MQYDKSVTSYSISNRDAHVTWKVTLPCRRSPLATRPHDNHTACNQLPQRNCTTQLCTRRTWRPLRSVDIRRFRWLGRSGQSSLHRCSYKLTMFQIINWNFSTVRHIECFLQLPYRLNLWHGKTDCHSAMDVEIMIICFFSPRLTANEADTQWSVARIWQRQEALVNSPIATLLRKHCANID